MINLVDEIFMTARSEGSNFHCPVLLSEVISYLRPSPGKTFLDATLGGGGHTEALLAAGATVFGADRDPAAIALCSARLFDLGDRFHAIESNFAELGEKLRALSLTQLDGVLLDLGVSSHQFDTPERGFSIQRDGPLDMRMSPNASGITAATLVNESTEQELARLFADLGEEKHPRRIAAALVRLRAHHPFTSTKQLAQAVERVVPRSGSRHPATRVFQALRIAVNRELEFLQIALPDLSRWLRPGGRFAIITFHSLEDRIVKNYFRMVSRQWDDRPEWPEPRRNPHYQFRLLTPHPIEPGTQESRENPRARSAKLRVIEKL
jgi:16S rRNA (cytosine1402-N4)-methyltransferase